MVLMEEMEIIIQHKVDIHATIIRYFILLSKYLCKNLSRQNEAKEKKHNKVDKLNCKI